MKKNVLLLLLTVSLGSYAASMEKKTTSVSVDELNKQLRKQNDHGHKGNTDKCEHECTSKKAKVLSQIKSIKYAIEIKAVEKEKGHKQIEQIKTHWNDEHPNDEIK